MKKIDTYKLVRTALMTALAAALTLFPKVPVGAGYVHFGDSVVYMASIFMGPLSGAIAGAAGHSIADWISGYPIFVLPTFIIKGIMGYTIGKIAYGKYHAKSFAFAAAAALLIVTAGYFVAEFVLLGAGAAMISLISSPIQWVMSIAASAALMPVFRKLNKL